MSRAPALAACVVALVIAWPRPAAAQAGRPASDPGDAAGRLDCSVLAKMPNPPMSVEACEARKRSVGNLDAAVDTPGGERPGDAQMSCTQVIAEMQSLHFAGISQGTAQEGAQAGSELQAAYQGSQARAGAMAARHTAETMAVGAMPNAVQGAVMYRHAAEQQALGAQNSAAMRPARERVMAANTASSNELAANLRANPRFARLMALVQEKNCQMSDAPQGSTPP